jgi:hypothetical protein
VGALESCGLKGALALCGLKAVTDAELMSPLIAGGVITMAATAIKAATMPEVGWRADPLTSPQFVVLLQRRIWTYDLFSGVRRPD